MTLRCPYCKHTFEAIKKKQKQCPHCYKIFLSHDIAPFSHTLLHEKDENKESNPLFLLRNKPTNLLIIITVMMIMGYLLIGKVNNPSPPDNSAKIILAKENMTGLYTALNQLHSHCGRYPSTKEGLVSLIHNPKIEGCQGPYIFELKPDPWNHLFRYSNNEGIISLYSMGPDGIEESFDDIIHSSNEESQIKGYYHATLIPEK